MTAAPLLRNSRLFVLLLLLLLDVGNATSLHPARRHLRPRHLLRELAPVHRARRFLKLVKINPRNGLARRKNLDPPSPILVASGKQQMYLRCSAIVFSWYAVEYQPLLCFALPRFASDLPFLASFSTQIRHVSSRIALGTLFYSLYNQWPLPQSFFYAVDAGMSIGFCTDVVEPDVTSRAFTVVYILLGASCVGGALVLMVQSILEQAAQRSLVRYKRILEKDGFKKAFFRTTRGGWMTFLSGVPNSSSSSSSSSDGQGGGSLSYDEFRGTLEKNLGKQLSEEEFHRVCQTYDPRQRGFITYEDFKKIFKGNDNILSALRDNHKPFLLRWLLRVWGTVAPIFTDENKRIYLIFIAYICVGVTWGIINQGWDVITATHFAVSALATGGLTAPPVDENGILPAGPAIFCGLYCIFGIPLFALTLSQFASVLVENYIVEEELLAIKRPLTQSEFQFASQSLCSSDIGIHLSDFIVLQLFRQGKLSLESLEFMKRQFQLLDTNRSGRLNWDEAQKYHV